jgi:hypothetical protein
MPAGESGAEILTFMQIAVVFAGLERARIRERSSTAWAFICGTCGCE